MSTSAGNSERLVDLLAGHRTTAAICAAVELGVIEALAFGSRTPQKVAAACATHEEATGRLLTVLAALGICERSGPESFGLSEIGAQLVKGAAQSLRDWALFEGKMLASSWLGLGESIRQGKTRSELAGTAGRYEELGGDQESASLFDAAMLSMTRVAANNMLGAYDFASAGRILDVGGGNGALLIEILRAHPALTGCVLDLPRCETGFRRALGEVDLTERAAFMCGDFFDDIPRGFDTILLKSVLHNWDDASCSSILANCRKAMGPGGKALIMERLLPDLSEGSSLSFASVALNDLNMLRGPGGRERTETEYRKLVADAGLAITTVLPAGRFTVLTVGA